MASINYKVKCVTWKTMQIVITNISKSTQNIGRDIQHFIDTYEEETILNETVG